ncbi:MAG: hypothetical protein WCJ77_04475 [Opitutae bacterium]
MARKLFVLSVLTFTLVGCMGPEKGPSPVTDTGLSVFGNAPAFDTLTPLSPSPASKTTAKKSKGKLPLNSSSQK